MATRFRKSALILLLAVIASPAASQKIVFSAVSSEAIAERTKLVDRRDERRKQNLIQLFTEAGCDETKRSEQPVKGTRLPNLVCVLRGEDDSTIIVGAHYDHVEMGVGAVDNWSGVALLPSLFQSLKDSPRRHTFVFVGFTAEERGLVGSRSYVQQMNEEERGRTLAMVNLDSLGLAPTKVWQSHADRQLLEALISVAGAMDSPLQGVNVERVGSSDSESFARAKIPAITIHSVTTETLPIIHSMKDQISAIRQEDYYQTYRLVAGYLAFLDSFLPRPK